MAIIINRPPRMPEPAELKLGVGSNILLDGGINLRNDPTQIRDNQSPHMVNMLPYDNGSILGKRPGQRYVYSTSLGSGGVNGAYERLWSGEKVFAWGTAIYRQSGSNAPVAIMTGLSNRKGKFYPFGGKLYYLNGAEFVEIDDSFNAAAVTPYVPTLLISTPPAGGGTPHEQVNLLTPSFKISFSSDGTSTKYYFPFTGLDAAPVTVEVNGDPKTEGVHYTVNRSATPYAYVDFAGGSSPLGPIPAGAPNNVIVTAAKTVPGNAEKIKYCRYLIDYGGENDTRLFAWGNPNYPNRVFRSGLLDASYWPENEFSDVGSSSEAVVACAKHYDKLVYLKERSLYFTVYTNPVTQGFWGATQIGASFPLYPINAAVGCDMPGTVQIIDNNVVFFNSRTGGHILVSTQIKDERNVFPITGNILPALLAHSPAELAAASSVDHDGRYWLCVGNSAYVWDYRISPYVTTGDVSTDEARLSWFPMTGINAACWIQDGPDLYYGARDAGRLVEFHNNYNDFGSPIDAVWRSKRWNFNLPHWLKTIKKAWFTAKAGGYSKYTIRYISENSETVAVEEVNVNSFRWNTAAWDTWTWFVNEYPPPILIKPKTKKVVYFQIEFQNNRLNENLALMNIVVPFMIVRKVK